MLIYCRVSSISPLPLLVQMTVALYNEAEGKRWHQSSGDGMPYAHDPFITGEKWRLDQTFKTLKCPSLANLILSSGVFNSRFWVFHTAASVACTSNALILLQWLMGSHFLSKNVPKILLQLLNLWVFAWLSDRTRRLNTSSFALRNWDGYFCNYWTFYKPKDYRLIENYPYMQP